MKEITPNQLAPIFENQNNNIIVLDVRTEEERDEVHIPETHHIPLQDLPNRTNELKGYDTIYIHCRSGGRSGKACELLETLGFDNTINLAGGILLWEEEGLEVIRS